MKKVFYQLLRSNMVFVKKYDFNAARDKPKDKKNDLQI